MRKMMPLAAFLVLLALHGESGAQTTQQLTQSRSDLAQHAWQAEDKCNQNAWAQYPDYTKEGNEKRERAFRLCQMNGHLPPRAPLVAPAIPSLSGQPMH